MKKFNEFREEAQKDAFPGPASPSAETSPDMGEVPPAVKADTVNKPTMDEPTADHGNAERGSKGEETPTPQGSSDTTEFKVAPDAKVFHPAFGEGKVLATMDEGVEEVATVMFDDRIQNVHSWELEAPKPTEE